MPYVLETLDPLKYCEVTDTYYIWDPNTGIWTDYSKISLEEHLSTTYRHTVNTARKRALNEFLEVVEKEVEELNKEEKKAYDRLNKGWKNIYVAVKKSLF